MKKMLLIFLAAVMALLSGSAWEVQAQEEPDTLRHLESIVETAMQKSGTPGASVAIVNSDGVELYEYGYADAKEKVPVTEDTLFELGSMSKAFTAFGILYLEQEGILKLDDDIRKYLPWFYVTYEGKDREEKAVKEASITVNNLLYHSSGIPAETIGYVPEGNASNMLELTVRNLCGTELDFNPGDKFSYSTVNYDILGLIIETLSGESYEDFITQKICVPLGLNHTYLFKDQAKSTGLFAKGYKTSFLKTWEYKAPDYRGNTPAGYVISSASDMARWMQIQMDLIDVPEPYEGLIAKSHISDKTVASGGDFFYAAGWNSSVKGNLLMHGGSNPNYSSMLLMDKEAGIGICVLTNLNSSAPEYIAGNYYNTVNGTKIKDYKRDVYQSMDIIFSALLTVLSVFGVVLLAALALASSEILKGGRKRMGQGNKVAGTVLVLLIIIFYGYCIYYLPHILFNRMPWKSVIVWGAGSVLYGCICAFLTGVLFLTYIMVTFRFPKPGEKNYFALIPLSVLNGLASALIIFVINESFNRNLEYSKELLIYFLFALVFYVYTIKLLQGRMIIITNEMAYEKRIAVIDKVMETSYQTMERIGSSRIYSSLNNDAGAVSRLPGIIVSIASNSLTLLFCLAYLCSSSIAAFSASAAVIVLNCIVGYLTGRVASHYWEKNRDVQDIYFTQMSDLVFGFKELLLSRPRKKEFGTHIRNYSRYSAELSKEASIKFLNFELYNTLMYNMIFGIVVFLFPLILIGISVNNLRENLFLVFYLIGPFGRLMESVPKLMEVKVNIKRIDQLIEELTEVSTVNCIEKKVRINQQDNLQFTIDKVCFQYDKEGDDKDSFLLGPVDAKIKTGETTFIIGGNGSGKSTLGKILTGLYSPDSGSVSVNGEIMGTKELNEYFSAVYSDFHLFSRLYGIDYGGKKGLIHHLLQEMKMDDKVKLDDTGEFKDLNFSAGQRKRLAFVICCLDNKPFMLFDEWAAEQDPEFRMYFYTEMLPRLREQGKGVIVITHDDRFFGLADNIIKLERGKMI